MKHRFTVNGRAELEAKLNCICSCVARGVRACIPARTLQGLLLAGGYGRGEGGVLRTAERDLPYNDLEFFVFIRGMTRLNELRYAGTLHELAERMTQLAGIEVEFKILSLGKLRRSAPSMFYYDLMMGHDWLIGSESLLHGCEHHADASRIPLHEATRLLMNRCSGLLYAKSRLQEPEFSSDDADFVNRNIAKAQLAMGDVLLAMHGTYHWSCRVRRERLQEMETTFPCMEQIKRHHRDGVHFKLLPDNGTEGKASLETRLDEISQLAQSLWLWLESRRLGRAFRNVQGYALSPAPKCPEHAWWKNAAINVRTFKSRCFKAGALLRYPRERLLRSLSLLLWGVTDSQEKMMVAACLQCPSDNFPESVQAYTNLWHRFN